jgi:peptidoglycan/xylan/chitin deacetylase (PgdA/CDA1 family)
MERRAFLLALAAGTLAGLTGCGNRLRSAAPSGKVSRIAAANRLPPLAPENLAAINRTVPASVVDSIPGTAPYVALTIDDGTDSAVVAAYLEFIKASGIRLTFFPNGVYPSWTDHAAILRPLVDSGQVQLGNHTWSHPNLLTLGDAEVADEVSRNEQFLTNMFGVSGKPFLRPPYGSHSDRTDRITADLGYWVTTMWYGSFGDSALLSEAQLLANAREWLRPRRLVIGHANHPMISRLYPQIVEILRERSLQTVTLNDVFITR